MDLMSKSVRVPIRRVQVVIQIVHMHCPIAETPSRRNVEISDDFVDAKPPFNSTPLTALSIKLFAVVFSLALFNVFATAKSP